MKAITLRPQTLSKIERVYGAAVYACQMLDAINFLHNRKGELKGWVKAHLELRRALRAAGFPARELTFRIPDSSEDTNAAARTRTRLHGRPRRGAK